MKEAKFIRVRKSIIDIENNKTENFDSVNLAKKQSAAIQFAKDGALGKGTVQVQK